jgi:nicotinate-nucleotide adenylyltransferase
MSADGSGSSKARRVGLFGGSFDPIHRGHVDPVIRARDELRLDQVVFLPTAEPPHKEGRRFAPALQRFCMVELALLEHRDLVVSTHELTIGRKAYTIDTVEHFARALPGAELFLLVGADSFLELDQWRRHEELLDLVTLVVLARPGFALEPASRPSGAEGRQVLFVESAQVAVSSTDLRERLRRGELPEPEAMSRRVVDYCRKYALYR